MSREVQVLAGDPFDADKKAAEPEYLTAKDVAARYGQKLRWVYNCTTLPRRKIGKKLVFRIDELLEFETTWKRATPSYRVFKTMKEMGKGTSHNAEHCWVVEPERKPGKFKLLLDIL